MKLFDVMPLEIIISSRIFYSIFSYSSALSMLNSKEIFRSLHAFSLICYLIHWTWNAQFDEQFNENLASD